MERRLSIDPASGNEIRPTDNGRRECDLEAPQDKRPLTEAEIKELVKEARDGDR
jgi:hypothetical protein